MNTLSKQTVVAVLYPGCVFFELALAIELLAEKYQVVFATPDGSDHQASNGAVLRATASYKTVDLSSCNAVLIPGGDPGSIKDNKDIDHLIQTANSKGLLLAAICAGPFLLAKANILKGKRIAHGYGPAQLDFLKPHFDGVQLTAENFVCDGNVITAKPEAHIDFAVEIACRLEAADASKANRIKDYYRGILGRKIRPLALALFRNPKGQFLFHLGHDNVKGETFYRPLGGGIEFSETGSIALQREMLEELHQEVQVSELMACFENIFTFEGVKGHEVILLFSADFRNSAVYQQSELDIFESDTVVGKAVWRSVEQIKLEGSKLYPTGIESVLNGQ